jgi:hypothetical protein
MQSSTTRQFLGSVVTVKSVGWHGAKLEEILDLCHVMLVPVFRTSNIPTPVAWIPNFHSMIESDEYDFLIFIDWYKLPQTAWNQNPPCFINVR